MLCHAVAHGVAHAAHPFLGVLCVFVQGKLRVVAL